MPAGASLSISLDCVVMLQADCVLLDPNQFLLDDAPAELVADADGIGEATIALTASSATSGGTYSVQCDDTIGGATASDFRMYAIPAA